MEIKKLYVNGTPTGVTVELAETFLQRVIGLMGRAAMRRGGMLLFACQSIHTFFMRFDIDVLFLDDRCRVLSITQHLRPWRIVLPVAHARFALELACGMAKTLELKPGDTLTFREYQPEEA